MKPSEWFIVRNAGYYVYSGEVVTDEDAKFYNRILNLLEAAEGWDGKEWNSEEVLSAATLVLKEK